MKFGFPFLDIFTLPTGATDGIRIVFDGINGRIEFYNSNNVLIGLIEPNSEDGLDIFAMDESGAFVRIFSGDGAALVQLNPPDLVGVTYVPGNVQAQSGDANNGPTLVVVSPSQDTLTRTRIFVRGEGDTVGPLVAMDAASGIPIDFLLNGVSQGRGYVADTFGNGDTAAIGTTETVVGTISDVEFIADRAYRLSLGGAIVPSAVNQGLFRLREGTTTGGTLYWGPSRQSGVTAAASISIHDEGYIRRLAADGDLTTDVCVTLESTSGTTIWRGTTERPRFLLIEDVGDAGDYQFANEIT